MPNSMGGQGQGQRKGKGKGQGKNGCKGGFKQQNTDPCGNCVCDSCGTTVPHQRGTPCMQVNCPNCGSPMIRQ